MADSITSSQTLGIGIEYDDGGGAKTTTINIPNFRRNVTESEIKNAFQNNNVIIYGYDLTSGDPLPVLPENIVTAATTQQTINVIDIGVEE